MENFRIKQGVAKRADITAVQVNTWTDPVLEALELEIFLSALTQVYDDVVSNRYNDKAVLQMSISFDDDSSGDAYVTAYEYANYKIIKALLEKDVAVVVSVPNGEEALCSGPPCIFGKSGTEHYLPDLITVGAGDIDDGLYLFDSEQRDDWVTIYGPGDDSKPDEDGDDIGLLCANITGKENNELTQFGNSHGEPIRDAVVTETNWCIATAMVAGLMAYFKGQ